MNSGKIFSLIIVASGKSERFGTAQKKQYLPLKNGTVLSNALVPFLKVSNYAQIVITYPKDEAERIARAALQKDIYLAKMLSQLSVKFLEGGESRQESVYLALKSLSQKTDIVLIHDAARPFVSEEIIRAVLEKSASAKSAAPCITPSDTQKIINENGEIEIHLDRSKTAIIQTPQAFAFPEILDAHEKARCDGKVYTDDTEIFANYVGKVSTVPGDVKNKKITYKDDVSMNNIRIGFGYDMHRLKEGRRLLIGGVEIPSEKGEDAHSDGDVLLHAITDSLLGAAGLGDIGAFFPDTDAKWKDADSKELLKIVWEKIKAQNWSIVNIDCVVKLEKPKFLPFRDEVCECIANLLEIDRAQIFVKAKTGEKLGEVGNGLALEAWATCLLENYTH